VRDVHVTLQFAVAPVFIASPPRVLCAEATNAKADAKSAKAEAVRRIRSEQDRAAAAEAMATALKDSVCWRDSVSASH
jgi:hypothetical protein